MQALSSTPVTAAKVANMPVFKHPHSFESTKAINHRIVIQVSDTFHFINLTDIIRLEADGNYTHIYLNNQTHFITTKTIGTFYNALPKNQFIRCHQSHVVNRKHISQIIKYEELVMTDEKVVRISRSNKKLIKKWVSEMRLF